MGVFYHCVSSKVFDYKHQKLTPANLNEKEIVRQVTESIEVLKN